MESQNNIVVRAPIKKRKISEKHPPKIRYGWKGLKFATTIRRALCPPCGDWLEYQAFMLKESPPQYLTAYNQHISRMIRAVNRKVNHETHCYICGRRIRGQKGHTDYMQMARDGFISFRTNRDGAYVRNDRRSRARHVPSDTEESGVSSEESEELESDDPHNSEHETEDLVREIVQKGI